MNKTQKKYKEIVKLFSLEYGDYFEFIGRQQMYVVIFKNYNQIKYQSTYSGRIYNVLSYQDTASKQVGIFSYGS